MLQRTLVLGLAGVGVSALMALSAPSTTLAACTFGGDGSGSSLQGVFDDITTAPVSGDSSVDVTTDCLADSNDTQWSIDGGTGSVTTIVIELAGFADGNLFGIYDAADTTNMVQIFGGLDGTGDTALITILADGSVYVNFVDTGIDFDGNEFGFYLDSSVFADGGTWYSDTDENSDGVDHMYAYQGTNTDTIQILPFAPGTFSDGQSILAFEDLNCDPDGFGVSCDGDYTDFVVLVSSVTPMLMSEPVALLLFGVGLLGLGAFYRRQ